MTEIRGCCLCSQIQGCEENDLIAHLLPGVPYARRIMMESDSFAVLPSLGPLVRGHSLLCPKAHTRSFAHLDSHLHAEYREVKARLEKRLRQIYGCGITLFEHGMAATGDRIPCSVEHAHLHFLPLANAFQAGVQADNEWIEFDGRLEMLSRLAQGREYIFHETPDGVCRILTRADEGFLESQYMRRIIARGLGPSVHWNWREAPNPMAADEAWRQFVRHFPGTGA